MLLCQPCLNLGYHTIKIHSANVEMEISACPSCQARWERTDLHTGIVSCSVGADHDCFINATGERAAQVPAVTVDTAVAVQLVTRSGQLHQLRVQVPALLAGSAMEDASSPMLTQRVSMDSAPLLGLQGLNVSMASSGMHHCCPASTAGSLSSSLSNLPCHLSESTASAHASVLWWP